MAFDVHFGLCAIFPRSVSRPLSNALRERAYEEIIYYCGIGD
jgi:hypothetical protein